MKKAIYAAGVLAVLALGACTNPDRSGALAPLGGPGAGGPGAGTSADPASPAYFSEVVGDRVLFAVDQSTLGAEARTVLDGQAAWLMRNADYLARIEGHADEQGTREYNIGLGAERANAVREYLVSRGVPEARLTTVSFGKERPVAVCSDESCYAQNRRAVTVITIATIG